MTWAVGELLTATNLNTYLPQGRTTWSSPISSGITEGNGTTLAHYTRLGPLIFAYFKFALGSTSAITGDIVLDLPIDLLAQRLSGEAYFEDATGSRYKASVDALASTTAVVVRPITTGSTYAEIATAATNLIPFTWTTSDVIVANFWYFIA